MESINSIRFAVRTMYWYSEIIFKACKVSISLWNIGSVPWIPIEVPSSSSVGFCFCTCIARKKFQTVNKHENPKSFKNAVNASFAIHLMTFGSSRIQFKLEQILLFFFFRDENDSRNVSPRRQRSNIHKSNSSLAKQCCWEMQNIPSNNPLYWIKFPQPPRKSRMLIRTLPWANVCQQISSLSWNDPCKLFSCIVHRLQKVLTSWKLSIEWTILPSSSVVLFAFYVVLSTIISTDAQEKHFPSFLKHNMSDANSYYSLLPVFHAVEPTQFHPIFPTQLLHHNFPIEYRFLFFISW